MSKSVGSIANRGDVKSVSAVEAENISNQLKPDLGQGLSVHFVSFNGIIHGKGSFVCLHNVRREALEKNIFK